MSVVDWIVWGIFLTFFGGVIIIPILYIFCFCAYAGVVESSEWTVKTAKGIWFELTPFLPGWCTSDEAKKRWAGAYLYARMCETLGNPCAYRLYNRDTVFNLSRPRVTAWPGFEKLVFEILKSRGNDCPKHASKTCIRKADVWNGKDPGGFMTAEIHRINKKFVERYEETDVYSKPVTCHCHIPAA